jgi:hypothetical protein
VQKKLQLEFKREAPETIKGVMDCSVEALTLQKFEQGKITSFSGYKDGPEIGDKLELTYSLELGTDPKLSATVVKVPVNSWDDLRFMLGARQLAKVFTKLGHR